MESVQPSPTPPYDPQPGIGIGSSFTPTPHLPGPGRSGQPLWAHSRPPPRPSLSAPCTYKGQVGRGARIDLRMQYSSESGRWARWDPRFSTELEGSLGRRDPTSGTASRTPPPRPHTNLVVDVLQGFLARGPPDLHLPARFNRWLPAGAPALPGVRRLRVGAQVGDVPLLSHHLPRAPAHRQRVEVDGLVLGGPFHRAEHATEFLPGLGAA